MHSKGNYIHLLGLNRMYYAKSFAYIIDSRVTVIWVLLFLYDR